MKKASKNQPSPKKKPPARRRRSSGDANGLGILFVMALVVIAFIDRNVAILTFLGLLPTVTLGFTGKGDNKTQRMLTVAFTNASGILVIVGDVWNNPSAFERVLFDPNSWIIMWGAASVGYALNYVGPLISAMVLQSLAQDRVKQINQQKQDLVEMWGPEVLGKKEEEKPDYIKRPGR